MSYEEEDTCHMGRRIDVSDSVCGGIDTLCHMRRRIHVIWGGG